MQRYIDFSAVWSFNEVVFSAIWFFNEVVFHCLRFKEAHQKYIEYIGNFFIQMREISKFWQKVVHVCIRRKPGLTSVFLPEDQGGFTCM